MTTLYTHKDKSHWGEQFAMACGRAGVPFKFFGKLEEVPAGAHAFVRLSQQAEQRELSKGIIAQLHEQGVNTLPGPLDALLYDDKIAQYEYLEKYLPGTYIVRDRDEALELANNIRYPFVSKGSEGAASSCVRLIRTRKEARREVIQAFGDGLPGVYEKVQKDYVYWQRFIPKNKCDYRICVQGPFVYGVVRQNREDPNTPFASGSGDNAPITEMEPGTRERDAAELAIHIAQEIGSEWVAFDFVFEGEKVYCLEMSGSWTTFAYAQCPVWQYSANGGVFHPTDFKGGHMFDIAVALLRKADHEQESSE